MTRSNVHPSILKQWLAINNVRCDGCCSNVWTDTVMYRFVGMTWNIEVRESTEEVVTSAKYLPCNVGRDEG